MVIVPLTLEPQLKKYMISSAKLQGTLAGGGARRPGEAGLGDAPDGPVAGTIPAGEGNKGKTAWPPGNSDPSLLDVSERLLKSSDSVECKSCCPCCPHLVHGGGEIGGSRASSWGTTSCGWDSGGLCAICLRVLLLQVIVDSGGCMMGSHQIQGSIHTHAFILPDPSQASHQWSIIIHSCDTYIWQWNIS